MLLYKSEKSILFLMFERSVIEDIPDGDGDHVHELRERKNDEHAEAKEDMDLVHHRGISEERPRIAFEDDEPLRPSVEVHVMFEIAVDRLRRTKQACHDLKDDEHDEETSRRTGCWLSRHGCS
jgi:hypothetical protein